MTNKARTNSEELLRRRKAVVSAGVPQISNISVESARGSTLVDVDGRSFVDLATGIGVMSVGHCQPSVVAAIAEQSARLQHICIHIATYEPYVALCEALCAHLPHGSGGTKAALFNSGAEAVENAIKIARQATGRPSVICFTEGFHGRTLMGMSLTSKVGYKVGCGPFAPEVYRLPFPSYYRRGDGLAEHDFAARELSRFREALATVVSPADTAAVIIEVVQGEGGFVPVPFAYLRGLRKICSEHGIMLIVDEVQTGFCRTGAWAAFEHAGITPDLSTWAKAMGGGLPVSAVVGRAEVMDAATPGTIGGTFGGNPVACAAALATISLMDERDLCARAKFLGNIIREFFEELSKSIPAIGDVRGIGAMLGVELVRDRNTKEPASALAAEVRSACHDRGVLILTAGIHANVIRFLPPLTMEESELVPALEIIREELALRATDL